LQEWFSTCLGGGARLLATWRETKDDVIRTITQGPLSPPTGAPFFAGGGENRETIFRSPVSSLHR
jgi:hypothetical protein